MATTAARRIVRETWCNEGNAATMSGYCRNGSSEVNCNNGGKRKGNTAMTTEKYSFSAGSHPFPNEPSAYSVTQDALREFIKPEHVRACHRWR